MNSQIDAMRLYFARVRPVCPELFAEAYTICGDYETAERALQKVILDGWQGRRRFRSTRGFRDSLRIDMVKTALSMVKKGGMSTWNRLAGGMDDDPELAEITAVVSQESVELRRMTMLRYGCGLKVQQISRCMGLPARQIEQQLKRFVRRTGRRLSGMSRMHVESALKTLCREELRRGGESPDIGALYRSFQSEADSDYSRVTHTAARIGGGIAVVAAMLALVGLLWAVASVIRPAQIADDGPKTEQLSAQEAPSEAFGD